MVLHTDHGGFENGIYILLSVLLFMSH